MKQRITQEQLNELTPEQAANLKAWYDTKGYTGLDDCPLLTIGQLIEVLADKGVNISRIFAIPGGVEWSVYFANKVYAHLTSPNILTNSLSDKELCDALWKAVKKALPKT